MWDGKRKAVTFSYDDGIEMDRRLVEMFNKYDLKCTFNLNSGIQSGVNSFLNKGVNIRRMNIKGLKELYRGHEIAAHTLTHPNLLNFDDETVYNEIWQDKFNLENIFEQRVQGMAYPYGTFDERIQGIAKECNIKYARTVIETGEFKISENLLELKPSTSHGCGRIFDLMKQFIESEKEEAQLLYIWGHSYELEVENNWEKMEEICKSLARREDIYYGTNAEVLLD
ncbi:MAG TPA: polysaccharide deacetylase family protein, partial [Lachnospiraceae bacterium]|nr:polysaccharide deacetylase family protein [Lachnospiraceae bacterium]